MSAIEPGWYKDPVDPTIQRYWDGEGWYGDPLPAGATPPPGVPPPSLPPADEKPPGRIAPAAHGPATRAQPGIRPGQQPGHPTQQGHPGHQGHQGRPPAGQPPAGWPPSVPWPPPVMPYPPPGAPGAPPMPAAYARMFLPPPRPHGYALARLGRRFAARMVDIGMVLLLNVFVNGWFVYRYVQEIWPYIQVTWARTQAGQSLEDVPGRRTSDSLAFTITLIAAGLWFAYEVPARRQHRPDARQAAVGLKVRHASTATRRSASAGRSGAGTCSVCATLLWTCCGSASLFQFIDCCLVAVDQPLHQALHDKSAATVVVAPTPPTGSAARRRPEDAT